jgi:hypothetical protein
VASQQNIEDVLRLGPFASANYMTANEKEEFRQKAYKSGRRLFALAMYNKIFALDLISIL